MSLVTSDKILLDAQRNHYAVGAFNVENMEMAQAVISAAEEMRAPVMIQTTPSTVRYGTLPIYSAMLKALAERTDVPVVLHLDHGESFEMAMQALREGYTSIMIDGSHNIFEENVAITKKVVDAAKPNGIPVEAELGKVGGKEDELDGGNGGYTDPEEAVEFVEKTGISSLAVAIGTAHGIYAGTPKLDIERLKKIAKRISIPLVLHGASGLSNTDIKQCIAEGICKVNFATELRIAYSDGVKQVISENPSAFDPKKYGMSGRNKVKELVMNRIKVCGCENRY